jgi:hypothetical protein
MPREKLIQQIPPIPDLGHEHRMLVPREWTREYLGGISEATVRRMERAGTLDVIRLIDSPKAKIFHRIDQVYAVACGRRRR